MGAVPPVSLLDRIRERIRLNYYSIRTEQAYCDWIKRFVIFRGKARQSALGRYQHLDRCLSGRTRRFGKAGERLIWTPPSLQG